MTDRISEYLRHTKAQDGDAAVAVLTRPQPVQTLADTENGRRATKAMLMFSSAALLMIGGAMTAKLFRMKHFHTEGHSL